MIHEAQLRQDVAGFYDDPLGFVHYIYRWGEGDLKNHDGPDKWQRQQLIDIGDFVQEGEYAVACGKEIPAYQDATSSGHGIGKGAETAWINHWFMSTRKNANGIVTANTKTQLNTKTWRELSLWHKRALNEHWFEWTATKFYRKGHESTWYIAAIEWSEHRSEAFAGLHGEHVLVTFDEASGIPDKIWEVTEGAMTTPNAMWLVFGNPTLATGRFRACFGKFRHRWKRRVIDSRDCKMTNKAQLAQLVEDHGEDSDIVKVRVRGLFPGRAATQFISERTIDEGMKRVIPPGEWQASPRVVYCDPAYDGDDDTVMGVRKGLKAFRQIRISEFLKGYETAAKILDLVHMAPSDDPVRAIFVDAIGIGATVVERLELLGYGPIVIPVKFSNSSSEPQKYYNKRAECWGRLRDWLELGADIPDDDLLKDDLLSPRTKVPPKRDSECLMLETKAEIKKRDCASPDGADALAVSFAEPMRLHQSGTRSGRNFVPQDAEVGY